MNTLLEQFAPITLDEMSCVALLKRTDTKYVIHRSELPVVLKALFDDYKVLEIEGKRLMTYRTLYFDTGEKQFFLDHHNQRAGRVKVRMREYMDSGACFLEIKRKDKKGDTNKKRIAISEISTELKERWRAFLKKHGQDPDDLSPVIQNRFQRFTLVNTESRERVTVDLNLTFTRDSREVVFENLVIIELKQAAFTRQSPMVETLKLNRQNPYRLSKYIIGMISLYQGLKYNRFKAKFLRLKKIGV